MSPRRESRGTDSSQGDSVEPGPLALLGGCMKRLTITFLAAALLVSAQKIETQKPDRTRITRLETALNHLTVIEVGEPIEQVAAGSSDFKVEWRGNRVFIQPLEAEAATNLFIWTQSGSRLNYEMVPAVSVEGMHFAIDQEAPVVAKLTPVVVSVKPIVPPDMLLHSVPVRSAGHTDRKNGVEVVIQDLYEADGKLFLRYAIRNKSTGLYQPSSPSVVSLNGPRSRRSLYALTGSQLFGDFAAKIKADGQAAVKVSHSELASTVLRPGQETTGILALSIKREGAPQVLRLRFPADRDREVVATLVL